LLAKISKLKRHESQKSHQQLENNFLFESGVSGAQTMAFAQE